MTSPNTEPDEYTGKSAFARGAPSQTAELRGECPKAILNVLDAVSLSRDKTRTALVNEILGDWAKKVLHEASLVQRLTEGNPPIPETAGGRP